MPTREPAEEPPEPTPWIDLAGIRIGDSLRSCVGVPLELFESETAVFSLRPEGVDAAAAVAAWTLPTAFGWEARTREGAWLLAWTGRRRAYDFEATDAATGGPAAAFVQRRYRAAGEIRGHETHGLRARPGARIWTVRSPAGVLATVRVGAAARRDGPSPALTIRPDEAARASAEAGLVVVMACLFVQMWARAGGSAGAGAVDGGNGGSI